jgi:hypothetical protein
VNSPPAAALARPRAQARSPLPCAPRGATNWSNCCGYGGWWRAWRTGGAVVVSSPAMTSGPFSRPTVSIPALPRS